jgi:hypothetical protein
MRPFAPIVSVEANWCLTTAADSSFANKLDNLQSCSAFDPPLSSCTLDRKGAKRHESRIGQELADLFSRGPTFCIIALSSTTALA